MNNQFLDNSVLDCFLKLEKEHQLFDIKINRRKVWPRIRHQVSEYISHVKVNEERTYLKRQRESRIIWELCTLLFDLLKLAIQFFRLRKNISTIVFLQDDKFIKKDGKLVNQWLHPYIEHSIDNDEFIFLANIPKERERLFKTLDMVNLRPFYLLIRVINYFDRFRKYDHIGPKKIQRIFNDELGKKIPIEELISDHFFYHLRLEKLWNIILDRLRPAKLIFVHGAPSPHLGRSCTNKSVILIELQHCQISRMNVNYCCDESLHSEIKSFIPKYILTYGDFWKTQINLPIESITAGYWYFHYLSKGSSEKAEKNKSIVVISAKGTREYLYQAAKILAEKNTDYIIYYKLRPDEYEYWKEIPIYSDADNPENLIFLDDDSSIYKYFSEALYTVSINSTMLYEASALGSRGIVLEHGEFEELEYLYQNNFAKLINLKELKELNIEDLRVKLTTIDSSEFFKQPDINQALKAIRINERNLKMV